MIKIKVYIEKEVFLVIMEKEKMALLSIHKDSHIL